MPNDKLHINDAILVRFIEQDVNAEERLAVLDWLSADEQNEKHFALLEKIWVETAQVKCNHLTINKPAAWQVLDDKIKKHDSNKLFKLRTWLSIAAVAALILGIFVFSPSSINNETYVVSNNVSTPLVDTLPDGSQIQLKSGAQLSYQYDKRMSKRSVALSGEAFFDVKRDEYHPFVIDVAKGSIEVLGTSFNVDASDTNTILVSVVSGSVELTYPRNNGIDSLNIVLSPNEEGVFLSSKDTLYIRAMKPAVSFWATKRLVFKNQPLIEVFEVLASCYDTNILWDIDGVETMHFTSVFQGSDLEDILHVIMSTHDLSFLKNNGTYMIRNNVSTNE